MGSKILRTRSIRKRRDHHNYWLDPTFRASESRCIRCLPDRTLASADEYEERLRKYEARQAKERVGGGAQRQLHFGGVSFGS